MITFLAGLEMLHDGSNRYQIVFWCIIITIDLVLAFKFILKSSHRICSQILCGYVHFLCRLAYTKRGSARSLLKRPKQVGQADRRRCPNGTSAWADGQHSEGAATAFSRCVTFLDFIPVIPFGYFRIRTGIDFLFPRPEKRYFVPDELGRIIR